MNTLMDGLDPMQLRAASADVKERLLVVAGPGTGKTQVSAMRLSYLLGDGLAPSQILVLCFSRSAVRTLTRRLDALAQTGGDIVEDLRHLSIRTFDSWAFRLLRMSGLQPRDLMRGSFDDNIDHLARLLESGQSEHLETFLSKIRHIVIDEAQDIGGPRLKLVKVLLARLAPPGGSGAGFTILGDDAQAIYQFAARTEDRDVAQFERCMAHVRDIYQGEIHEIELGTNHRASSEMAEAVRILRQLFCLDVEDADKLREMEHFVAGLPAVCEEMLSPTWLAAIPPGSLAILTRTNGEALRVATHLSGKRNTAPDVPVHLHVAGASAPVPAWVAALLWKVPGDAVNRPMFRRIHSHISRTYGEAVCRSMALPTEDCAWLRLIRACGLGEHETSFSMSTLRERMAWPDAFPDDQVPSEATVLVTTIHQSKGLEFDNVVLLQSENAEESADGGGTEDADDDDADEDDVCPDANAGEEASVLFVGVTRAARHIGRLPRTSIYAPYRGRQFGRHRRLLRWWNGWVNLEVGIAGDLDPVSFVDSAVHGSANEVEAVQQLLLARGEELRGHKVMLRKLVEQTEEGVGRVHYNMHLQDGTVPGPLLGRTCSQLTFDLKRLLGSKYPLPYCIMNLRIGQIVSVPAPVEMPLSVPDPWRVSQLWLGVTLYGTGDFQTPKKRK